MARLTPYMIETERIPLRLPFIDNAYIRLDGARRFTYLMQKIPDIMNQAAERGMMRFAKQLLMIIRKSMATGMPPPGSGVSWAPLSPRTIKMYNTWKYPDAHLWNVIGQMQREIRIIKTKTFTRVGFTTGVIAENPNPKGKSEGRPTLNKLSRILEFTGDLHPGRPLWNPAYKSAGGDTRLTKFVKQELRREVRKHVGKYYG